MLELNHVKRIPGRQHSESKAPVVGDLDIDKTVRIGNWIELDAVASTAWRHVGCLGRDQDWRSILRPRKTVKSSASRISEGRDRGAKVIV
jgi:hypothetical protein